MSAIIGTAGHIDHGKTALIKALTGLDTDRLKEEKERGISIDLGFAYLDVGGGERAGIVDVPGHERFIRNMLAGAHGMDLVLFVVAADDGVMPQTEEHLDILHLLGVTRGIVAITKVDLVDQGRRARVRDEIGALLVGTTLAGAAVIEVSSATGEGVEELRGLIRRCLHQFSRPPSTGSFRLPVDRAFVMRGHGLVVTGTAIAGSVRVEDRVRILPGGRESRVRSVQVHGEMIGQAHRGQRVALNLSGVERGAVSRGHVVCAWELDRVTDRFDAWVEIRPAAGRPVANHTPVRVHLGTAEVMGKITWVDGARAISPGRQTCAQIALREPIGAFGGDRFILRDQTAQVTIGGGTVLHPFARPLGKADGRSTLLAALRKATSSEQRLMALLRLETGFSAAPEDLAAAGGLDVQAVNAVLDGIPDVIPLPRAAQPEAYTTKEKWAALCREVAGLLQTFHEDAPEQPGLEMESLRSRLATDLSPKLFRAVVARMGGEGVLVREESLVRLPSHRRGIAASDRELAAEAVRLLEEAGFTPPALAELERHLGAEGQRLRDVLAHLEREGKVARVAPGLFYAGAVLGRARDMIREHVAAHGQITAADLRDLIGASRKFSIALLNYFDRTGFTMRVGDVRKLRR